MIVKSEQTSLVCSIYYADDIFHFPWVRVVEFPECIGLKGRAKEGFSIFKKKRKTPSWTSQQICHENYFAIPSKVKLPISD